eukprot:2265233-Lingulodinium_polyedra.AAC.1
MANDTNWQRTTRQYAHLLAKCATCAKADTCGRANVRTPYYKNTCNRRCSLHRDVPLIGHGQ